MQTHSIPLPPQRWSHCLLQQISDFLPQREFWDVSSPHVIALFTDIVHTCQILSLSILIVYLFVLFFNLVFCFKYFNINLCLFVSKTVWFSFICVIAVFRFNLWSMFDFEDAFRGSWFAEKWKLFVSDLRDNVMRTQIHDYYPLPIKKIVSG